MGSFHPAHKFAGVPAHHPLDHHAHPIVHLRWTREGGRRRSESRNRRGRPQDCRSRSRPRGHSRSGYVGERPWTHLRRWSLPTRRKPPGDAQGTSSWDNVSPPEHCLV